MLRHIDLGRALVLLGAGLLLVSLFLDWYDAGGTAWEVFETLDLLLAATALACAWAALRRDDTAWDRVLRLAPLVALAVVVVQLVSAPPVLQLADDAFRAEGAGDPDTGAWLALGGTALMAAGAVLTAARISVTIDVAERPAAPAATTAPVASPAPAAEPAPKRGATLLDRREEAVTEVAAVDRRTDPAPEDEPPPTQPLRVPPDEA